jgi:hypothetical protein
LEVGSTLALKAMHNYLARYGFDRACQELDTVYRLSNHGNQGGLCDEDQRNGARIAEVKLPGKNNSN